MGCCCCKTSTGDKIDSQYDNLIVSVPSPLILEDVSKDDSDYSDVPLFRNVPSSDDDAAELSSDEELEFAEKLRKSQNDA